MSAPETPPPPTEGKVTHHSIELMWEKALEAANDSCTKGDGRVKVCVQEEEKSGAWANVYTGYGKTTTVDGLEPWTSYKFRMRFMNSCGNSEWSTAITVSTIKEPMTGEHLHKAILLEDLNKLEKVLESGDLSEVQVDTPDKYGFSPLMQASQKGYIEFIECLVRYGSDVNFQNDAGKTSLMLACYAGKLAAVKELRHYGASYTLRDKGGSTAMHWAMDGGNLELIEWMIDDGADFAMTDYNGWTPLLRTAAVGGNKDAANLLIRYKADINVKDKDGKTTLMIAVVNGHQGLVELLLTKGADLSIQNDYGKTAYDMALSMERRPMIRLIETFLEKEGKK